MSVIDEKVVEMKFDNQDFQNGVAESINTLDKLEQALATIGSNIRDTAVERVADNITNSFSAMEVAIGTIIYRVTNSVYDMVARINSKLSEVTFQPIFAGFSKYETQIGSVQTMMTATGKSIDEVTKQLDKLMWYTDETSYSYTQMSDSVSKFVSAGVGLEDAVTAMIGIANWAGAAGANVQQANIAMYNLAQAMGKGSVTAQDWASIETATMATEDFKQAIVDTAKEFKHWGTEYSKVIQTTSIDSDKFKEIMDANGHTMEQVEKFLNYADTKLPKDINWNTLDANNMQAYLSTKWLSTEVLVETLRKYGNYTEDLYRIYNEGDYETANEAIDAYFDQYSGIVDKLYDVYSKYGKNSKQFREIINSNDITMQTALDLIDTRKAQIHNAALIKTEETFKSLVNSYGKDSDQLAKAAKEAGYSLEEALDIVENGTKNYEQVTKSRGEQGFANAQEAKTFTDAWGSAIEAASSQWLRFWNTIIGNYEEAKVSWTDLSNTLWDIFAGPIDKLNEVAKSWAESGGRDILIESFSNIYEASVRFIEPIKNAFLDVFSIFSDTNKLGDFFYNWTVQLKEFTKTLFITNNNFLYLRVIAESVFSTFKFLINVTNELFAAVGRVINSLLPSGETALSFIAELSLNLFKLEEYTDDISLFFAAKAAFVISKIDELKRSLSGFVDVIKGIYFIITNQEESVKPSILNNFIDSGIYDKLVAVRGAFLALGEAVSNFWTTLTSIDVSPVFDLLHKLDEPFQKIATGLFKIFLTVVEISTKIVTVIVNVVSKLIGFKSSWDEIFSDLAGNEVIKGFVEDVRSIFGHIWDIVSGILPFLGRVFNYILETIKEVNIVRVIILNTILGIGSFFFSAIATLKDNLWNFVTSITNLFGKPFIKIGEVIKGGLGTVKAGFTDFLGYVKNFTTEVFNTLDEMEYMKAVTDMLMALGKSMLMIAGAAVLFSSIPNPQAFIQAIVGLTGAFGALYAMVTKFSGENPIEKLFGEGKDIGEAVEGGTKASLFGSVDVVAKMGSFSALLISFSASIGIVAASVALLVKTLDGVKYPLEHAVISVGAVAALMGILYLSVVGMTKAIEMPESVLSTSKNTVGFSLKYGIQRTSEATKAESPAKMFISKINGTTKLIKSIAMALIPMTIAVKVLGSMEPKQMALGLFAVGSELAFLYFAVKGFTKITKTMSFKDLDRYKLTIQGFKTVTNSLIGIAAAVGLMAIPIKTIGKMDIKAWAKGLGGATVVMLELVGFTKLIQLVSKNLSANVTTINKSGFMSMASSYTQVIKSLIPIAIAVGIASASLVSIGKLDLPSVFEGIAAISIIMLELYGMLDGISKLMTTANAGSMLAAAGAMDLISVSVGLMAAPIIAISLVSSQLQNGVQDGLAGVFDSLIMLAATLYGFTLIMTPDKIAQVLAGAGAVAIIGVAVDLVAAAVIGMSTLNEKLSIGILGVVGILSSLVLLCVALSEISVEGLTLVAFGAGLTAVGIGLNVVSKAVEGFSIMTFGQILSSMYGMAAVMAVIAVLASALSAAALPMALFGLAMAAVGAGMLLVGLGVDAIHTALFNIINDPYVQTVLQDIIDLFTTLIEKLTVATEKFREFWSQANRRNKNGELYDPTTGEWYNPVTTDYTPGENKIADTLNPNLSGTPDTTDFDYLAGLNHDGMKHVGEMGVEGLKEGSIGYDKIAEDNIVGKDGYITTVDKTLGINSPSEEMKKRGSYVLEGFKIGTNGFDKVAKTDAELYTEIFGDELGYQDYVYFERQGERVVARFKSGTSGLSDAGKDDGKSYADGFTESAQDWLDKANVDKLTERNFLGTGTVAVDEWTKLGMFAGHQYVIGFNGSVMALGEFHNGSFTKGSYLAALQEAAKYSSKAYDEFSKYVTFDENGDIINGIFSYNGVGDIQKQWDDYLQSRVKEDAKAVKTGLLGWIDSLSVSEGIKGWLTSKAGEFSDKLGLGSMFNIEEVTENFKNSFTGAYNNADEFLDTTKFEKSFEELIENIKETGYSFDDVTESEEKTAKATTALQKKQYELKLAQDKLTKANETLAMYQNRLDENTNKYISTLDKLREKTEKVFVLDEQEGHRYSDMILGILGDTESMYTTGKDSGLAYGEGFMDGVDEASEGAVMPTGTELGVAANRIIAAEKYGVMSDEFTKFLNDEQKKLDKNERWQLVLDDKALIESTKEALGDDIIDPAVEKLEKAITDAAKNGLKSNTFEQAVSDYIQYTNAENQKTHKMTRDEAIDIVTAMNDNSQLKKNYRLTAEEQKKKEDNWYKTKIEPYTDAEGNFYGKEEDLNKSFEFDDEFQKLIDNQNTTADQIIDFAAKNMSNEYRWNMVDQMDQNQKRTADILETYAPLFYDLDKKNTTNGMRVFFKEGTTEEQMRPYVEQAKVNQENAEAEAKFEAEAAAKEWKEAYNDAGKLEKKAMAMQYLYNIIFPEGWEDDKTQKAYIKRLKKNPKENDILSTYDYLGLTVEEGAEYVSHLINQFYKADSGYYKNEQEWMKSRKESDYWAQSILGDDPDKEFITRMLVEPFSKDTTYILESLGMTFEEGIGLLEDILADYAINMNGDDKVEKYENEYILELFKQYGPNSPEWKRLMKYLGYDSKKEQKEFTDNVQKALEIQAQMKNDESLIKLNEQKVRAEEQNVSRIQQQYNTMQANEDAKKYSEVTDLDEETEKKKAEETSEATKENTKSTAESSASTSESSASTASTSETISATLSTISKTLNDNLAVINEKNLTIETNTTNISNKLDRLEKIETDNASILTTINNINTNLNDNINNKLNNISVNSNSIFTSTNSIQTWLTTTFLPSFNTLSSYASGIKDNTSTFATMGVYIDGKTLVGKIAPEMDKALGRYAIARR